MSIKIFFISKVLSPFLFQIAVVEVAGASVGLDMDYLGIIWDVKFYDDNIVIVEGACLLVADHNE